MSNKTHALTADCTMQPRARMVGFAEQVLHSSRMVRMLERVQPFHFCTDLPAELGFLYICHLEGSALLGGAMHL
jgi:hypothetical protein